MSGEQPPTPRTRDADHRAHDRSDDIARWGLIFAGVVAIAAMVQAALLYCHAALMRRSAEAADRSVRLERPWVLIGPEGNPLDWEKMFPSVADTMLPQIAFPKTTKLTWSMRNHGKTQAMIESFWVDYRFFPAELPRDPPYGRPATLPDWPLPIDKPHINEKPFVITADDWSAFVNERTCLVFYGIVNYRDVNRDPHTTRFCCVWFVKKAPAGKRELYFAPFGPPRWIEYT